ncbi:MAG TPA: hypothetical protein VM925_25025 [Labilithrix sp.]|nr:hypothetical protein [Labilithrix sp.]
MSKIHVSVVSVVFAGVVACSAGSQHLGSNDARDDAGVQDAPNGAKNRFTLEATNEDVADWAGQRITIEVEGVAVAVDGGVTVTADPQVTKVKATARFAALALSKADSDLSIADAAQTFTITRSGDEIKLACGHGQTHGSSNGAESGCEHVDVRIPVGVAARKLDVSVISGNGTLGLRLGAASIQRVVASSKGSVDAELPTTLGASVALVSENDDIVVTLPPSFAADEVIVEADDDKIDLGPFTDIKHGSGAGGRGPAGTGLASLKMTAKPFAGSTGSITLR